MVRDSGNESVGAGRRNIVVVKSDDPLSEEISVSGELTETGFKASAKSRFVSATDRLLGNGVDWFSYRLERAASLARAQTSADVKIIQAIAEAATLQINTDSELVRRAIESHIHRTVEKRKNVEAVIEAAFEDLRDLPPPPSEDPDPAAEAVELDGDWLNFFESYAERASSENMRKLWGRILSGEIRQPKSFSLSTLRVVSELNPETANLFRNVAVRRLNDDYLVRQPIAQGAKLRELLQLEAAGLLQEVNGNLGLPQTLATAGEHAIQIRSLVLMISLNERTKTSIRIPVLALSPAGKELAAIIEPDDLGAARDVATSMPHEILYASAYRILGVSGPNLTYDKAGVVIIPAEQSTKE